MCNQIKSLEKIFKFAKLKILWNQKEFLIKTFQPNLFAVGIRKSFCNISFFKNSQNSNLVHIKVLDILPFKIAQFD